jgi:cold shock CspA family protein
MTGKVVKYDVHRAFGKVWAVGYGAVFVHRDDLLDVLTLTPGQRVEFRVVETERGLRGIDVRPVEFVA